MPSSSAQIARPQQAAYEGAAEGETAAGRAERVWQGIASVLLAGIAVLMLATLNDYGVTWDEFNHITYGREVLRWYSSGFQDRAAINHRLFNLQGGVFDGTAAALASATGWSVVLVRHALGAIAAWGGLLYTYRLGRLLGGARAGVFALLALALTPVYYGHAFNNPKDTPLAALFTVATFYIVSAILSFPRIRWSLALKLGVAIGLALGLRIVAVSLFLYLGLAFALYLLLFLLHRSRDRIQHLAQSLRAFVPPVLVAGVIAYAVMLLFWPAAQVDPIDYVLTTFRRVQSYPWNLPVLFDGEMVRARQLPRSYVIQWMMISLPEFVFVGLLACLICGALALRTFRWDGQPNVRWVAFALLLFATCFPLAYQALRGSPVYDAWRHFLFVTPPLAILVGCGLSQVLSTSARGGSVLKWPLLAAAGISALLTAVDMVQLHPYQNIYFNHTIAGGVARAASKYETDYWGSSHKEGVAWLEANYHPDAPPGSITVGSCGHPFMVSHYLKAPRFVHIGDPTENDVVPDVALAITRWNCHKRVGGRLLHVIERKGAPILYITEILDIAGDQRTSNRR